MKILLGVTGGIAAYKSLELTRLFIKAGFQVQVVMTAGAKAFIQPLSFQALSGHPVRDSLFDTNQEAGMGHIELARWADQIVIAPASAETLAKLRMGRADDLLTTLCLATDKPIMVAPAMNRLMWMNAATQDNVRVLKQRGFTLLEPAEGEQACGEVGAGRMPEPIDIFDAVVAFQTQFTMLQTQTDQAWFNAKSFWQGKSLLITAGPTFEDIDPVRFIGNRSSGKMGFAIAEVASKLGAKVTVIAGPIQLVTPLGVKRINVRSAQQMLTAVQALYSGVDCFISAAAVADFKVKQIAEHKLKKQTDSDEVTLTFIKNPDIVAWVAAQADKPFVVGFAAETQNVLEYARDKLQRKSLDMICANKVGDNQGFEQNDNALTFITATEQVEQSLSSKEQQAVTLLSFIAQQSF
ncbi:bifunctional phosphopantothenoylcysteine decarboxylase/phosphopantothenate--cysteine ligase CoaBC [Thiomicrorhabdus arctica]|jgi:phosphopantothenoylcysteine decarboxylase/phosphopantothenate--cysteine ligase|uniref:bifunctional phosphopantothenoylcysteine decarboxylase/phosphopantothenate--cysteine ligase CoaBC n=1 Tax=Thiomicrorhabdus arctica TaxID=131540 RepID=UPI0003787890|nr:bifunctional phosphopantothenoylcysteine decarboxylase/phosphopantothenate--cysteine ligase CoaBC [Thiomicrorhabdus arctica]